MELLKSGSYFGDKINTLNIDNLILTETEFCGNFVDWHYHENLHFSYSLIGNSYQSCKKNKIPISQGTLIYHNSEDPHCNSKHSQYSKNFYVEIKNQWFENIGFESNLPKGVIDLKNPFLQKAIDQVYLETKINESASRVAIESLLINSFTILQKTTLVEKSKNPKWVNKVKELIHNQPNENFSLLNISKNAQIHPVHLSREFSKYFGASLSLYIRMIKIQKAASLLKGDSHSLANIAYSCGFSDQSHFTRCFKQIYGVTPNHYKRINLKC